MSESARIAEVYAARPENTTEPDRYSLRRTDVLYREQEVERAICRMLSDLSRKQILEVGCGEGKWLREFIRLGARPHNLMGLDLQPSCIAKAWEMLPSAVNLMVGSATDIPCPDRSFDIVCQFTTFSSMPKGLRLVAADEMRRVLRTGGLILWYDMAINNPFNPAIEGISKRELRFLFPGMRTVRRISLAAPIARRLPTWMQWISVLKVANSHLLAIGGKSQ